MVGAEERSKNPWMVGAEERSSKFGSLETFLVLFKVIYTDELRNI